MSMTTRTCYHFKWDRPINFEITRKPRIDLTISCVNTYEKYVFKVHKFIIASYCRTFREQFEKNRRIKHIVISGCNFVVLKTILDFLHYGEIKIAEDHISNLIAYVKLFGIKSFEEFFVEHVEFLRFKGQNTILPQINYLTKLPSVTDPTFIYTYASPKDLVDFYANSRNRPELQNFSKPDPNPQISKKNVPSNPNNAETTKDQLPHNVNVIADGSIGMIQNLTIPDSNLSTPNNVEVTEDELLNTANLTASNSNLQMIYEFQNIVPSNVIVIYKTNDGNIADELFYVHVDNSLYPLQIFTEPDSNIQILIAEENGDKPTILKDGSYLVIDNSVFTIQHLIEPNPQLTEKLVYETNDGNNLEVTEDVRHNVLKLGFNYLVLNADGEIIEIRNIPEVEKEQQEVNMDVSQSNIVHCSAMPSKAVVADSTSQDIILPFSPDMFFADVPSIY